MSFKRLSKKTKSVIKKRVVFFILIVTSILTFYSFRIYPVLSNSLVSVVSNTITGDINDAILNYMSDSDTSSYVAVKYNSTGEVSSVEIDSQRINDARAKVLKIAVNELESSKIEHIDLPVSCLFDDTILYGKGPKITFSAISSHKYSAKLKSEFKETGINQTVHSIFILFKAEIIIDLPLKQLKVPIEIKHILSEILIVGDVPDAYTKINRLLDDISESEIDDIYDFGAVDPDQ